MSAARHPKISRRRVLAISAAVAGLAIVLPVSLARAATPAKTLHVWRGLALGADATLILNDDDPDRARRLIGLMQREIARLEAVFSLYRTDSALARLNAAGRLDAPPLDLVRILELCGQLHRTSGGAFDPSVQPLWALLRAHFEAAPAGDERGPPAAALEAAHAKVGYAQVAWSSERIAFAHPGMALTLNGIAQGYIADRVCDLLRGEGVERALVDLGEARALGEHPAGRPWRAVIPDPTGATPAAEISLRQAALATSSPLGTCFDQGARFSHLLDPWSGGSASACHVVSVTAASAADADGLSTAIAVRPSIAVESIAAWPGIGVRLVTLDGAIVTLGDWPTA